MEILCSLEHIHERSEVVAIVEYWLVNRLAYCLRSSKVNHTSDRAFLLECLIHRTLVSTVDLIERWTNASDLLDAIDDRCLRV